MLRRIAFALFSALAFALPAHADPIVIHGPRWNVVFWKGGEAEARHYLALLETMAPFPDLPTNLPRPGATVILVSDRHIFDSLTDGRLPEWGEAFAIPSKRTILVPLFRNGDVAGSVRTLRHEVAHIALHDYLTDRMVPRWFDEGYAQLASGTFDSHAAWTLRWSFLSGRAPPLDSLTIDFPADANSAGTAYLLSATAVGALHELGSDYAFHRFLERWKAGGTLEDALYATYGLTFPRFEEEWRKSVGHRYGWILTATDAAITWSLVAIVLVGFVFVRRSRVQQRLDRQRELDDRETGYQMPPSRGED